MRKIGLKVEIRIRDFIYHPDPGGNLISAGPDKGRNSNSAQVLSHNLWKTTKCYFVLRDIIEKLVFSPQPKGEFAMDLLRQIMGGGSKFVSDFIAFQESCDDQISPSRWRGRSPAGIRSEGISDIPGKERDSENQKK